MQEVVTSAGSRATVVGVANTATAITDGLNPLIGLTGGSGFLLLSAAGLAGSFSASASLNVVGLAVTSGTVRVDLNSTGVPVDETFTINGTSVMIRVRGPPLQVVILDAIATLTLPSSLGTVELGGDLLFDHDGTRTVLAVTDASVTLANAGMFGAEGAFLVSTTGIAGVVSGLASVATGTLDVGARVGVRINSTGSPVSATTVTVDGRSFTISFLEAAVLDVFAAAAGSFAVGSFVTIEGTVTFADDKATGTGVAIFLGEGPAFLPGTTTPNPAARGVLISDATFTLLRSGSGSLSRFALSAAGTITVIGVPGLSVNGSVTGRLRINTTGAPVTDPDPAFDAPFDTGAELLALDVTDLALTLNGRTLRADAVVTRITTSSGLEGLAIAVSDASFDLAASATTVVAVTAAAGALLLTSRGVAAVVTGTVAIGDPSIASVTGTLVVNTTGVAVRERVGLLDMDLAAGTYLRITADLGAGGISLAGQTLTGSLTFESAGNDVRARIAGGRLAFSAGTTDVLVVSGVAGDLLLDGDGFVGTLSGALSSMLGSVGISGAVLVAVDTRAATPSVTATGSGVVVAVAGQTVTGDVTITQGAGEVTIALTAARLDLEVLRVTLDNASMTVSATGLTANLSGSVESRLSGVAVSGTGAVTIDTSATTPLSAVITGLSLTAAGHTLAGGTATVSPTTSLGPDLAPGGGDDEPALLVAVANLTFAMGGLAVSDVDGALLMTSRAVAGTLTATLRRGTLTSLDFGPGLSVTIDLNTLGQPVHTSFGTTTIELPAGPYLRLAATSETIEATIGSTTFALAGTFVFESQQRATGGPITVVAVTDLSVTVGTQTLTSGRGAFVVAGSGVAGLASGTVAGAGSFALRFNATGADVTETVIVGETAFPIVLAAGVAELTGAVSLSIGGFMTFEGTVTFTAPANDRQSFGAVGATLFLGQGPYRLGDGTVNPSARGVVLRNARVGIVRRVSTDTLAVVADGILEVVGVPGLTLAGNGRLEFNRTGTAVDQTITFDADPVTPGAQSESVRVLFGTGADVTSLTTSALTVDVAGQRLVGAAAFSRTEVGGTVIVGVAFTGLDVRLAGLVEADNATGSFELRPNGFAGTATATGTSGASALRVGPGTGITLTAVTGAVSVDTTSPTPVFTLAATAAQLGFDGVTLQADITVRAVGTNIAITVADGSSTIGGAPVSAAVTNVSGVLRLGPAGLAGRLDASVTLTAPGLDSATGTWALTVNTMAAGITELLAIADSPPIAVTLPAGPFVRLEGSDVALRSAPDRP